MRGVDVRVREGRVGQGASVRITNVDGLYLIAEPKGFKAL